MQPLIENTANTPAFLGKLWKMVNDPGTDHVISWSPTGTSFIIQNQAQFWYELLPLYYKHNNMSSFVRQLNMYGFHKMSTVENGTMDADKDEIQFTHPYFIKDQPELLKNIKRKAAVKTAENCGKHDELSKILTDVKQLRGRQASVDNQLNAMKQENALLWREVAILRQKHLKQQKIVNKLIQFLVTLVQPSRMTVGVKRGYQLMLNESPSKKSKSSNNKTNNNPEGPTIHELDSELDLPTTIYEEETPLIDSPTTSVSSQQAELHSPMQTQLLVDNNGDVSTETGWDQPEFVSVNTEDAPDELNLNAQDELNLNAPDELNLNAPDELILSDDITEENLINTLENESSEADNGPVNEKVFLNASAPDTFLSNFIKKNYSKGKDSQEKANDSKLTSVTPTPVANNSNMALATRDKFMKSIPSTSDVYNSDLSQHVESTQSELDQFKDILNNYNSYVDANALLGELNKIPQYFKDVNLFNDEHPVYDLNVNQEREDNLVDPADPLVSGSELAPYGSTFDFTELLDDSIDGDNTAEVALPVASNDGPYSSINTPQILKEEPIFPAIQNKK